MVPDKVMVGSKPDRIMIVIMIVIMMRNKTTDGDHNSPNLI